MISDNLINALKCVSDVIDGEISFFNFYTLERDESAKVLGVVEHSLMWMDVDSHSAGILCEMKKELESNISLSSLYL